MTISLSFTASDLQSRFGDALYPESLVVREAEALWLTRGGEGKRLAILARPESSLLAQFPGESQEFDSGFSLRLCPLIPSAARALRQVLPWLQPIPVGAVTAAGFGDRLGLATPGHVRAMRAASATSEPAIIPFFAQQSIREMARTGRSPDEVLADATWGAFEAGWRGPVGADADHLKTTADIDACAAAGFSFFTFDPGAHVDSAADTDTPDMIEGKVQALPWAGLESSSADLRQRLAGATIELEDRLLLLPNEAIWRAAAKYGRAVAHVAEMFRHLEAKGVPFEVEVSVDETETPTSEAEHYYFAHELKRLGVRWVSLAPRYVGRFEKGVDYIGDLDDLRRDLQGHAAIARAVGPYKLGLHSGSDKFSVYPLIAEAARGAVHLKTAGTSYLEALRAIALVQPALFREIAALGIERYPTDRATYHVSAEASRVPALETVTDERLPDLLDQFDAREVLHVTFGSALAQFGAEIKACLRAHEGEHYAALERHFVKHLQPFIAAHAG